MVAPWTSSAGSVARPVRLWLRARNTALLLLLSAPLLLFLTLPLLALLARALLLAPERHAVPGGERLDGGGGGQRRRIERRLGGGRGRAG